MSKILDFQLFVTKLVYDRSLQANQRADEMFEKLMVDDAHAIETDRKIEQEIRSQVFKKQPPTFIKRNNSLA